MSPVLASAVLEMLPHAIAIALTPIAVTATLLFLASSRPLPRAIALFVGSVLTQGIVGVIGIAVIDGEGFGSSGQPPHWMLIGQTVAGLVLVVIGIRAVMPAFTGRRPPQDESERPAWLRSIDAMSVPVAFGIGIANMTINVGNLIFTLGGAAVIAESDPSGAAAAGLLIVFVLISHITVWGPIGGYVFFPARSETVLAGMESWLARNSPIVLGAILLFIGWNLAMSGAAALANV
jgi:hypothetical protein